MRYVLMVLLLGCATTPATETPNTTKSQPTSEATVKPNATKPANCLVQWEINSNGSVLNEQRSLGTPWFDFATAYKAAKIDKSTFTPVKATAQVKIPDGPVLWFTPDKKDAVIDVAFSSDLTVVDIPRLSEGEEKTIGTLSSERALFAVNYGQEILELLIRADVLRTYWHIGSTLCLTQSARDETQIGGGYRAEVIGTHTYFTNEKNVEPLAFFFQISPSGVLSVRGLPRK